MYPYFAPNLIFLCILISFWKGWRVHPIARHLHYVMKEAMAFAKTFWVTWWDMQLEDWIASFLEEVPWQGMGHSAATIYHVYFAKTYKIKHFDIMLCIVLFCPVLPESYCVTDPGWPLWQEWYIFQVLLEIWKCVACWAWIKLLEIHELLTKLRIARQRGIFSELWRT